MFCKNCGNQVPDGVAFCAACGTPLTPAKPEDTEDKTVQVNPNRIDDSWAEMEIGDIQFDNCHSFRRNFKIRS